jgi:hypothetical protein
VVKGEGGGTGVDEVDPPGVVDFDDDHLAARRSARSSVTRGS